MNNPQQTARVGLFFLLGLALTWVTFETLSGGKVFQDEGYTLIAGFESLKELKEGDEVRMAGVKIGEVLQTRLAGRRAEAVLRIASEFQVKSDATATIVMSGLIGTNYIGLDLGSIDAPALPPGAELKTKTTPDINSVMSEIGQLSQKLEGALGSIGTALTGDPNQPGIVQKIDQLVTENREKIGATLTNIQQISDKVNKGEGTLGRIISDPKLHDELVATITEIKTSVNQAKTFLDNAQAIMTDVKAGKGTIGALVYDPKAGEDIKASIANIRAVSDKISRGEGTLGKLLSDDTMLRDAQAIMKKADRALDGLDDSGPITAVGVVARGLF
jgi:phospholipid/cholesterol/gamma-HCH transport system substrate-binding protein